MDGVGAVALYPRLTITLYFNISQFLCETLKNIERPGYEASGVGGWWEGECFAKGSWAWCNTAILIFVFHSTDRYCNKTTVINGVTIPKDATIIVPITLLHHSPVYWKDPEKFDPNRSVCKIPTTSLLAPLGRVYIMVKGHYVCKEHT